MPTRDCNRILNKMDRMTQDIKTISQFPTTALFVIPAQAEIQKLAVFSLKVRFHRPFSGFLLSQERRE
ncbi:MAG: hypothetical protein F4Y44_01210 [Chloroflexi bacterium]|nr:hypothetical protein [Chloroflexota bacterium]